MNVEWPPIRPIGDSFSALFIDEVLSFKDQPITLFDATVAVLAQRTGLPVWTYDHHFDVMRVPVWR
jgi:predicted nucleic acid-binding protein